MQEPGGESGTSDAFIERARIREVIEDFVVWFDSGDFESFRSVWHPEGIMNTTRGPVAANEFAARAERNWAAGGAVGSHAQGGSTVRIVGERGIAQTKVVLNSRLAVDDVLCDAVCIARFYDFFERRESHWRIVERQPIYERDRLDPVQPATQLHLDGALLARFPEGYRHLAYAQTKNGLDIRTDLPCLRGEATERLYARGREWLAEAGTLPASERRLP
jgi:SnoaL-like domain